ncbi:MAG TPA: hypothetical protein VL625_02885 [Patescibacteria group bacterium]|nr:hypothetical protein [Patescibacteria group bacterium]
MPASVRGPVDRVHGLLFLMVSACLSRDSVVQRGIFQTPRPPRAQRRKESLCVLRLFAVKKILFSLLVIFLFFSGLVLWIFKRLQPGRGEDALTEARAQMRGPKQAAVTSISVAGINPDLFSRAGGEATGFMRP